jgi:hypothetical protein
MLPFFARYFEQSGRKSSSGVKLKIIPCQCVSFSYQKHAATLHITVEGLSLAYALFFCVTSGSISSPLVINKFSSTWFSGYRIQHLLPDMPLILFQKEQMTICKDSTNYTGDERTCPVDGS